MSNGNPGQAGGNQANDQLLERARTIIRELREKLAAAEAANAAQRRAAADGVDASAVSAAATPIAIVGMAADLPGTRTDLDAFWRMTVEGRDAVTAIPADRWDREEYYAPEAPTPGKMNIREAAFLGDVRRFDAAFFDIAPVEAVGMDPQQRIFLETAWHALEDAGLTRERLSGSETGVFVGIHSQSMDYFALQTADVDALDAYSATGTAQDVIAGRLAYWLNLQGPTMAVNSACSSSLVALHLACRSLAAGDCDAAVAGGVNLLLSPAVSVAAAQLQMLAGDGRSKTFDIRADGFGRGEGCGVVILKRLADAERDGDRVLAVIRGSAINQDGRTNGLTAPNGLAQQRLLRKALENAGVSASQVGFVETHGTGTTLGDPIEVEALAEVYASGERSFPCALGAVKANIGHLEGAAGIAGLIKAVLVLRHGYLPPVAHLQTLNPHLPVGDGGLLIPKEGRDWARKAGDGPRMAGVSSFGWSGTNAHVVLQEAPELPEAAAVGGPFLVAVSAETPEALVALALAFAERVERAAGRELQAIGYTSTVRRTHFAHRMAVVGADGAEIARILRARAAGELQGKRATGEDGGKLARLAEAYERGAGVDWTEMDATAARTVSLPLYPFGGKRYWLAARPASKSTSNLVARSAVAPEDWFYSMEWVEKPLEAIAGKIGAGSGATAAWLLVAGADGFGDRLLTELRARGERVVSLAASGLSGVGEALAIFVREGIASARVVFVAGQQGAEDLTAAAVETAQSVMASPMDVRLWWVTERAQSVGEASTPLGNSEQAALWGLARAFGVEHPTLAGAVVDFDGADADAAVRLVDEISVAAEARDSGVATQFEDRVAFRMGCRSVARLTRLASRPGDAAGGMAGMILREGGCYLVTGAFGGLGLEIAEWLVRHGARELLLAGRRRPEEMGRPLLVERLEALRAQGVTVHAEACDIADEASVACLFRDMAARGVPLYGVIHAAATVPFVPVSELGRSELEMTFRAKVEGARLLDRQTRAHPLDFFVLFSSAAASIGMRNAAHYAAANSCLNAMAEQRRREGFPALSVEWGLWANAAASEQLRMIGDSGFVPMAPSKALQALERLIVSGTATAVVADVDWQTLTPALEMRGRAALLAGLSGLAESRSGAGTAIAVGEAGGQSTAELRWQALRNSPAAKRREALIAFVGGEARAVFGLAADEPLDETRGLFEMGMNSLMSVALKKRLEAGVSLRLPGTLTLTYPTITALAGYLDEKLFPEESSAPQSDVAHVREDESLAAEMASVAAMDASEMDAAIAAELAALQQKLGVR